MKGRALHIDRGVSDWLKILSALAVVLHHYSQYALRAGFWPSSLPVEAFSAVSGPWAVAMFFFLSGYGLMDSEMRSPRGFAGFIGRRFAKVYLPVVLVTALWMATSHVVGLDHAQGTRLQPAAVAYSLFVGFGDSVLWFVQVLLWLYLAFGVFASVRRRSEPTAWALLTAMVVAVMAAAGRLIGTFEVMSVPMFAIGVFASRFRDRSIGGANITLLALAAYVILTPAGATAKYVMVNSASVALLIVLLTEFRPRAACPAMLGVLSFDLYLVHNKVLTAGTALIPHFSLINYLLLTALLALSFMALRTYVTDGKRKHPVPQRRTA